VVLDQGRIVGLGTHAQLMRACDVYRDIYRSQIGKEVA
jgi:ATP-binding cassette subfamily B multidrug efflux pump